MIKSPRKIRNYFISPKLQMNFGLYFTIVGLMPISILSAVYFFKFKEIHEHLISGSEVNTMLYEQINASLFDLSLTMIFVFIFYAVIAFLSSVVISHQVAGATVAILKYIDELKKGNYEYKRELRKKDALLPIMDSLKDLAKQLKSGK